MSEQAGWAAWLPPKAQRELAREDAREAAEARRAEEQRQVAAEEWQARNLSLFAAQAEARGEEFTAMQLATGQVSGRSLADIFAGAAAAGDREDAIAAARAAREGNGRVHIEYVADPVLHHARNETGRHMLNRYRRWKDALDKRKAAEEAEARTAYDIPLERPITLRSRRDTGGVVHVSPVARSEEARYRRACEEIGQPVDSGVRYR